MRVVAVCRHFNIESVGVDYYRAEFQYRDFRDSNTHPRKSGSTESWGCFGVRLTPRKDEEKTKMLHRRFFILAPYPAASAVASLPPDSPAEYGWAAAASTRFRVGKPSALFFGCGGGRGGSARVAPVGVGLSRGLRCIQTRPNARGGCLGSPVGVSSQREGAVAVPSPATRRRPVLRLVARHCGWSPGGAAVARWSSRRPVEQLVARWSNRRPVARLVARWSRSEG